ncbi:MAG: hypothetical protein K9I31_01360 [Chitinophagaceae bacterium]|jgi:hypothetical protein|nr:hypothetical protein [Chitinophagaceae bacterium]
MKTLYTLFILVITFTLVACNKETASTQTDVMNTLLTNKNWYLDYSITGTSTKSYVGQSTYFVTYLKDGTTKDSDGLTGTYTVEVINNQSQIHVQLKTANGNPLEVIYNIVSVGETKLVLSKVITTGTATQLFFTNK